MHSICLLLVICLAASWLPYSQAIRVDWGTNTGPIVPPPPRTTPAPPRQPYRQPAPVWEDQRDDVPNPKPYVYVLPPPSRPRTWVIPAGPYAPPNYNNQPPQRNYGHLLPPYSSSETGAGAVTGTVSVPALAAQYVPGVGMKYTAIVPNKLQGKYNAKTKKYKVYEKANKYAPWNYLQLLPLEQEKVKEEEEKELDQALDRREANNTELPNVPLFGSSPTVAPSSSSPTAESTTTTTAQATTTTKQTSTTQQPTTTTTTATTVGNYKLAHEKSVYLKKHNKLKKLLEKMNATPGHNSNNNNNNNNTSQANSS